MRFAPGLMLLATLPAFGADALLETCVAINDDAARLDCYDEAAGRGNYEARRPEPRLNRPTAQLPAPPAVPEIAATPPVPSAVAEAPPVRAVPAAPDDDFGLESVRTKDTREISSRLDGEFTGWSGRTLFKLENGQVWRQSEPGRFRTQLDRPLITIERGAFNSYRLKVAGMNRSVRVKRIR